MKDIGWVLLAPVGLVAFIVLGPFVAVGIVLWTILLSLYAITLYVLRGDAWHDLQRLRRWIFTTN